MEAQDYNDLAVALSAHFNSPAPQEQGDPRPVIRGSELTPQHKTAQKIGKQPAKGGTNINEVECSFDWYQATILPHIEAGEDKATPHKIMFAFLSAFGGTWEETRPRNGYDQGEKHSSGIELWWGGQNGLPHIKASSAISQDVADWLRSTFPRHRVARADVALDFIFPGAFDTLASIIDPIARQAKVACKFVGDLVENDPATDQPRAGRTWYYGASKSDLRITLYEKGHEQAGKGNTEADANWVRLEVRVRPQKTRKTQAATLEPFALIGFSKWISMAVGAILLEAPEPLPNPDKQGDKPVQHTLAHMANQYGAKLRQYVEAHGWQELNMFLYNEIYTAKERAKMEEGHAVAQPLRKHQKAAPAPLSASALIERQMQEARQ